MCTRSHKSEYYDKYNTLHFEYVLTAYYTNLTTLPEGIIIIITNCSIFKKEKYETLFHTFTQLYNTFLPCLYGRQQNIQIDLTLEKILIEMWLDCFSRV